MKKDIALTFITEGLALLCTLIVYRLAKAQFSAEGFAVYALCRRIHSFIAPALLIGCSVAIPRFIASSRAVEDNKADEYFTAAIVIVGLSTIIFTASVNLFPGHAAELLFGDKKFWTFGPSLCFMMAGYMFHAINYSFFRGYSNMKVCNILQLLNIGLIPIISMVVTTSPIGAIFVTGASWLVVSLICFLSLIRPKINLVFSFASLQKILNYGIQRVPADFGVAALFGLPATLTAHSLGVVSGGHVAFSISMLTLCGSTFAPIGLVLLPKASAAIARKDTALVQYYLKRVLFFTVALSLVITVIIEAFTGPILKVYLGNQVDPGLVASIKMVMLATVPFSIYVSLRGLVDAFYVKAVNTINILIALTVFLFVGWLLPLVSLDLFLPLINSLVFSLYVLGFCMLFVSYGIAVANR